jgi:hypothetical protein
MLKAKADGLADEVARLKTNSAKAQELANKHRMEAESKEKIPAPALADRPRFLAW